MVAEAVEVFERHRPRLFGLAYRMLGSAADAEDVVQDTFLRWRNTRPGSVEAPSAWLAKVATNLCLNRLDSARSRRERYVGQWLPEPVLTPDDALGPMETVEQRDTVSLAFLVLAERLTPGERAVFVLREAFGYSHREVAELVELSESNCRQLHRRARQRLAEAGPPRSPVDLPGHRALVERFLVAARNGDLAGLERLLAEDVSSVADGNGTPGVARRPVRGRATVARYLASSVSRGIGEAVVSIQEVNGAPAVLGWVGTTLVGVLAPQTTGTQTTGTQTTGTQTTGTQTTGAQITAIRIVVHPDKLRFLRDQAARLSRSPEVSGS
ncbi:RNA polymerase sigma factor SigJ [Actinosynnema sp. CS-041913]|uniref:RNA polymerase sigma factor SigJ n=1 Tax=Actinosynnema sp. CS-041913 TaxID=3239917 RepID=UPI003D9268AD